MIKVIQLMLATSIISLAAAGSAQASLGSFIGSGPGSITTSKPTPTSARMVYELRNDFGPATFTLSSVATTTETKLFKYDSAGFYSFFRVTASANAFSNGVSTSLYDFGPEDCCSEPSDGFRYTGFTTLQLVAGQTYGFSVTGSHFDRTQLIKGELNISAVPEPASWAFMIVGFGLVGSVARKRSRELAA